ncbi:hypothetical protein PI126_g16954 [Phytophthora idaei]|nr:hypothetical protein PI126_g16954 [Phytophthora idaei]
MLAWCHSMSVLKTANSSKTAMSTSRCSLVPMLRPTTTTAPVTRLTSMLTMVHAASAWKLTDAKPLRS